MKIVHVVRQFRPSIGGLENFVEQLALQQIAAGHEITVFTLNKVLRAQEAEPLPAKEFYRGIEIVRAPFWGSRRYPVATSVLDHISAADIVHVHAVDFFCDYLAATQAIHGKPLILTTHGGFFHTRFGRRLKKLYFRTITWLALTRFAAVVTCGPSDTRTFSVLRHRGLVEIPNAVDVKKFAGRADRDAKRAIYFGRLSTNKRLPDLLRWFAGLNRRDPDWRLTIAGAPYDVDSGEIEKAIADLGLEGAVDLYLSPSDEALGALIAQASVFACASDFEGFGIAAVEAASAGLFPVLSDIAAFRTTRQQLGYGQLVDFTDDISIEASCATLEEALAQHRKTFENERIAQGVAPYSWNVAARRYQLVYDAALGKSGRRIGPVNVSVFSERQALDLINQAIDTKVPQLFTFANAHTINMAVRHPDLQKALAKATVLNDGVGADFASQLLYGQAFPENLNGTDLMPKVLSSLPSGTRLFLVGSTDDNVRKAAEILHERYPDLVIAGYRSGFFELDEEAELADLIARSGSQIVLAGMGQPKQETWGERTLERVGASIICVGAFLDFSAGAVKRAPRSWRRLRLEWCYRLLQEPRRLASRYLAGNFVFLARVFGQYVAGYRV